jgi:hypothetical protein
MRRGSAVAASRGRHGILTIIASRLRGQPSFEIAKSAAVLARIRKWPTLLDQTQGVHSLRRQLGQARCSPDLRASRACAAASQSTDQHGQQQQPNESGYFLHGQLALANLDLRFDFLTQADMQFPQLLSSTLLGASVSRHCARWVFGKAITSRIDSAPAIIVTMRSRPKARPPCGGAPYLSASSRKPNFSCASSSPIPSALKTCSWTAAR